MVYLVEPTRCLHWSLLSLKSIIFLNAIFSSITLYSDNAVISVWFFFLVFRYVLFALLALYFLFLFFCCCVFVFVSFFYSRNWSRGSSGGPHCGRRSQCYLHCSGVPARHSSCSCCDMWWQWPGIWHPRLWSQILWRRRVSHFLVCVFSPSTGSIQW